MATIRDKPGHLETLPIDLLDAHLNAFFIFNYLDTMKGWSKLLLCNRAAQKSWFYNLSGLITCGDMARFVANRCHTPSRTSRRTGNQPGSVLTRSSRSYRQVGGAEIDLTAMPGLDGYPG